MITRKVIDNHSTWIAPAGVTKIRCLIDNPPEKLVSNSSNVIILISDSGRMFGFGKNDFGEIGDNTNGTNRSSPVEVVGFSQSVRFANAICGYDRVVTALSKDGILYSWGYDTSYGLLGDGASITKSSAIAVSAGTKIFRKLRIGTNVRAAIDDSNNLYTWGTNGYGMLGVGDVTVRSTPTAVLGNIKWEDVQTVGTISSTSGMLGIDVSGNLYIWGSGSYCPDGQAHSSPVLVPGGRKYKKIIGGKDGRQAYAIDVNGNVWAWGFNFSGEFGNNSTSSSSTPVQVLGITNAVDLIIDGNDCCHILTKTGALYGCGSNSNGQIGDGTTIPKSSPVLVVGGLNFKKVVPLGYGVMGLTQGGTVYTWGANSQGQLGNGTLNDCSSPVQIAGSLKAIDIFSDGDRRNFIVVAAGDVYAFGLNVYGQLGVGSASSTISTPTMVSSGIKWKALQPLQYADIAVTPGTTYAVDFEYPYIKFGNSLMPYGQSLTIEY